MERKLHDLKLNISYCPYVFKGDKLFEIRKNDRNFSVGDIVRFIPVNADGNFVFHDVLHKCYVITYVLSDFVGLSDGYVAFGIEWLK